MRLKTTFVFCILLLLPGVPDLYSYSFLTHEAIIDSAWKDSIEPILRERFPRVTDKDLKTAHAYAYGGSIFQDMGYYPVGSKFLTDLTHYVRSGDLVAGMLRDAFTLDEYAFALGALSHYVADTNGHSQGTNRAVPVMYPGLLHKYGDTVPYEDDPAAHLNAEFSFDVLQVAKGGYSPDAYHDFIGFEVAKHLVQVSFQHSYGLDADDASGNLDLAIGTFRRNISGLIPKMTQVAWEKKRDVIEKSQPGMTREKFLYKLSRADYEKNWGVQYDAPWFGSKVLTAPTPVLPKAGPFYALSFQAVSPEAEKLFTDSFNATVERYRSGLAAERARRTQPPNVNLDTAAPSDPGKYRLTDDTYAKLVDHLAKQQFADVPQDVKDNILAFYKDENAAISTKKDRRHWEKLQQQLEALRKGSSGSAR
jgi:Zinc dependent phospholipase C